MRAPHPTLAFWCERITYRTLDADDVADVSRYATTAPAEAIRRIRAEVRALAYALPPIERHRALSWVDGGGCVGAMGALHRGEPCGFSLSHQGRWTEWSVRPYLEFLPDGRAPIPVCGCPLDRGTGTAVLWAPKRTVRST
ncbi:hypothetical protein [Streptomyces sp. NBC_01089]|uniref:hypothetical protein n=1 Tax=Streptomyces sp. NBC_01089 TaxID=2903747 RepID=UPI00386735E7|nr:hypothetical protein OG510_19945 [Streptomyces sp. NBC_01089]